MERCPDELTISIIQAIADVLDRPVEDLPPISNSIDLGALDAIVPTDSTADVTVSFRYEDLYIVVRSGYVVYVQPINREDGMSQDIASFED